MLKFVAGLDWAYVVPSSVAFGMAAVPFIAYARRRKGVASDSTTTTRTEEPPLADGHQAQDPIPDEKALIRRVLADAITTLNKHKKILGESQLIQTRFNPDDRGEWEDRKGILHHDPAFSRAFESTDMAFTVIGLFDPRKPHEPLRLEAIHAIDEALRVLSSAQDVARR